MKTFSNIKKFVNIYYVYLFSYIYLYGYIFCWIYHTVKRTLWQIYIHTCRHQNKPQQDTYLPEPREICQKLKTERDEKHKTKLEPFPEMTSQHYNF